MIKAFLSHKRGDEEASKVLKEALGIVLQPGEIFRSEEIAKADDYRKAISQALVHAKFLILLYTDPTKDWSWCFYEVGCFVGAKQRQKRPVFCLHHPDVDPPGPIANLQTIRAERGDLEKWITTDLCAILRCKTPTKERLAEAVKKIGRLARGESPIHEYVLKPYILIEPEWPKSGEANWNAIDDLPEVDFAAASVLIDNQSAIQLGFPTVPRGLRLLPFLLRLDSDSTPRRADIPFWIAKLCESLHEAVKQRLLFQEVAYFRHESGRILRPIVTSFAKNPGGTCCKLRVIFASAYGAPLTDNPTVVQRLANGVRLSVRTRLEILDPFLNHMAEIHRNKVESDDPDEVIARKNPVGGRVVEALNAIMQEAMAHGFRPFEPPPRFFEDPSRQEAYAQLRIDSYRLREQLKASAAEEDSRGKGEYPESERLLMEMERINEDYLRLALPRLNELLCTPRSD
jgi:hypothetical protein